MTRRRLHQLSLFPLATRQATAEPAAQRRVSQCLAEAESPAEVESLAETESLAESASSEDAERPSAALEMLARLSSRFDQPIESLTLTRNRVRIVSARTGPAGGLALRMHRCFVDAPESVIEALAAFLGGRATVAARRAALAQLREHFRLHGSTDSAPRRRPTLVEKGLYFDLGEIRDRINHRYFEGKVEVDISWSPRRPLPRQNWRLPTRRLRRRGGFSIRLGSYHEIDRLVRIHRVLDREDVPLCVVESIVHHEMLHAVLPPVRRGSRRQVHGPDFRQRERQYQHFEQAEAWLAENIERLAALR